MAGLPQNPRWRALSAGFALLAHAFLAPGVAQADAQSDEARFRELFRELVEIDSSLATGNCTNAAQAMAQRLRDAGLPASDIRILGPEDRPREHALVATLRGRDRKAQPLLLLAHIDVVNARAEDWGRDPFKLVEADGWLTARGVADDKAMAAIFTDSLIRYREQQYVPRRDIKLALTCGEETSGQFNSVAWLLEHEPQALAAAFAINEGAGGELDAEGRPVALNIQAGEKVYQDFTLEVGDEGGHSSRPRRENAIYRMASALQRLEAYRFPVQFNDATRGYFEAQAELSPPDVAADMRAVLQSPTDEAAITRLWNRNPAWNAMLRTTCIATMIDGGHAPNAQPQHVKTNVNCRILPGVSVDSITQTLKDVVADEHVAITPSAEPVVIGPPPPLTTHMLDPVRKLAQTLWPGVAIVPTMATGATDGRFLNAAGIPTYGLSGIFHDAEGSHAHGLNEHLRVRSLLDGRRFLYEIVKVYAEQK
jgi:acetylornithine deacetylase/succinyl-diaminopimelate desuccinylase-like protein